MNRRSAGLSSRLRERVTIQSRNLVDNGRGGRKVPDGEPEWLDIANAIPAEIIALRGGEALEHAVQRSKQLWRVTIRARSGLSTAMRLAWNDPMFGPLIGNIRAAAPNDARDGIVMTVETGVAAA